MDFSEYSRRLAADPQARDPELQAARSYGTEFEQAALEAEALDRRLMAALDIPMPEDLLEQLSAIPGRSHARRWAGGWALAASVVLALSASTVWWQTHLPKTLPDYVAQHYAHDGVRLQKQAARQSGPVTADKVLAKFGVRIHGPLASQVRLAKFCPTPEGRGAHLVLNTPTGTVQLIYIPVAQASDGRDFEFDGIHARLLALGPATVALIGAPDQAFDETEALVRSGIQRVGAET